MPLTAAHTGLKSCSTGLENLSRWRHSQLHVAGEQGAALGHQSLIWLSQNKPGQPEESSANYYLWNCWSFHNQLKSTCTSRAGSRPEHGEAEISWEDVFLTLAYSQGSQHLLCTEPPPGELEGWPQSPTLRWPKFLYLGISHSPSKRNTAKTT